MAVNTHTLPAQAEPVLKPQERMYRSGGWITLILAMAMLLSVAASVQAAGWTAGLVVVQSAVLGGALLAFLLALTRWDSSFATVYSFLASIAWITTLLVTTVLQADNLHDGVVELIQHNSRWFTALLNGSASGDNLIFIIQLCLLGWWMAHFAIWSLFRHQRVWHAIVPPGAGLLVNAYYAPTDVKAYVVVFLVTVLMLAIRVELARNETRWQTARIRYAPDMYLDFLREGLVFAIVVVALAWMMPAVSFQGKKIDDLIQPLRQPWHDVQDTWQRMFTSLNYRPSGYVSTYGKSLTLGGPVSLTDQPVFDASVSRRTYWRGATFDTYTGQQWLNTDQQVVSFAEGEPFREPRYELTNVITATIRTLQDGQNVLFGPPQPSVTTLPVNASVTTLATNTNAADPPLAVSLLRSQTNLNKGSIYDVASYVTEAPPSLLRQDNTNYPDWVIQHYLQVPDELPARVRRMALRVTASASNPYDKASALETYLRGFTYNTQIPAPPEGMDGVDYFLFDIKQGYCDYYASAMTIMLRSVGIPARFVAGYASGEYDEQTNTYVVREDNAHAWVEVFFPSYGWIQFEPTASQPSLVRPNVSQARTIITPNSSRGELEAEMRDMLAQQQNQSGQPFAGTLPITSASWLEDHRSIVLAVAGGLAVLALLVAGLLALRRRNALSIDGQLLLGLFERIQGWAERLRIPWPASQTPLEHAHAFGRVLPEANEPIHRLTGLLLAQEYGRQQLTTDTLKSATVDWRRLQPALWRHWLGQQIRLPRWHRGRRS